MENKTGMAVELSEEQKDKNRLATLLNERNELLASLTKKDEEIGAVKEKIKRREEEAMEKARKGLEAALGHLPSETRAVMIANALSGFNKGAKAPAEKAKAAGRAPKEKFCNSCGEKFVPSPGKGNHVRCQTCKGA